MKKFGLIGHPIAHSLSPALFNAAFGGKYTYDLIEESDFNKAYDRFMEEYDAINITAPFKEKAYRKADTISKECQAIGAANILTKGNNCILAANSDIVGVTGSLGRNGINRNSDGTALIVGCGGAAMAAAYAMWEVLDHETFIVNRNVEKARAFATNMKEVTGRDSRLHVSGLESFCELFPMADVVIYTLPIAIPEIERLCCPRIKGVHSRTKRQAILEANYKDPAFTHEVMEKMRRINPELTFISGKEWLLYQAVGAYGFFTSDKPDIEAMRIVIER